LASTTVELLQYLFIRTCTLDLCRSAVLYTVRRLHQDLLELDYKCTTVQVEVSVTSTCNTVLVCRWTTDTGPVRHRTTARQKNEVGRGERSW
jgi:hypothetical protein